MSAPTPALLAAKFHRPAAPRTSYLVASGDVPAAWKVWIEL